MLGIKKSIMINIDRSQTEMNDDEHKIREWFIFSSRTRNKCSFHKPSRTSLKTARNPCASSGHWWPHLPLLQIQMFNDSKQPISDHIGNPELIVCAKQSWKLVPVESSCYSWNRKLNFPTCEWNWKPLLPTPQKAGGAGGGGGKLSIRRSLFQIHKLLFFFLSTWQEHQLSLKTPKITWENFTVAH